MILKKPYAFLIKYFRLIHLALAVPVIYLAYKSTNIVTFFNDYVANNYSLTINGELSTIFINSLMYLGIVLIILSSIAVYLLFKYKEKPRKHYVAIIIYYLLLFILISITHNILEVMQASAIEASIARSYRDISLLLVLPQYYFGIFIVLRALGFNVKKLNFADDIKELEISEKDSEEFEFVVGVEGYKAKRTFRRFIREFSYYIKENTFIFIAIVLLTLIGIGTTFYLNRDEKDIYYKQGDVFSYRTFTVNVEDSITTNLAYNGSIIAKNKYYLILKINLKNNSTNDQKLEYDNFRLQVGKNLMFPILDKASYFADYATPYDGKNITSQKEGDYVLVYELSKEQLQDEYDLLIYNNFKKEKDTIKTKYIHIKLTPILIDQTSEVNTVNLKDTLDLTNSNIGDTKLTINNYQITNKYMYNYERCYNNDCKTYTDYVTVNYNNSGNGSTLLILNYDLVLDLESNYSNYIKSERTFFNNFGSIKYKIGETEYVSQILNVTPNNTRDLLALQVSDRIKEATEIEFLITVRNKIYGVKLK